MKIIKVLLILLVFISCKKENENTKPKKNPFIKAKTVITEIDKLVSNKEIENFIQKTDTNYKKFELRKIQDFKRDKRDSINRILAEKVKANHSFIKADFDNNGFTDLLAIGDNYSVWGSVKNGEKISLDFTTIILMNFDNKYKIIDINKNRHSPIVPKVEYTNNQAFLAVYSATPLLSNFRKFKESKVKLTFKFGDFIEYNQNPKKHIIKKIEYSTTGCLGTCPIFKLEINNDRTAFFIAENYNFDDNQDHYTNKEEGNFKTTILENDFKELNEILNYIDFSNLKNYSVTWTDDQSSTLKITFDNGKVKTIYDYGLVGTYGLKKTYEILYNLRKNQNWKSIK